MLKAAVVMPDGTRAAVEEGTPQGGPLSPLQRLQINEEKSGVRNPEQVHLLGFRFLCNDRASPKTGITLSDKTKRAVMTPIRELKPPNWGRSMTSCMAGLSRYLNGWMAHYRLCTSEVAPELG